MDDILFKVNLLIAKGRNIIYYRTIDTRVRAVYMHILREYRQALVDILPDLPEEFNETKTKFQRLIEIIDPKVKTEECTQTILNMKEVFGDEQFN